jgi:miniconductance mechanosensitive channel
MEKIKIFVENFIQTIGVNSDYVPLLRHVLLIVVAFLLALLAGVICRRLVVPIILKLTAKTPARWDDVLFSERVLVSACHIVPAIVIWQLLPWVFYQYPVAREVLSRATAIYLTVMTVRTILVFISSIKDLEGERRTNRQQYLITVVGVLRIVLMLLAAIVVVAIIFDRSPLKLLAGLGATSAVLMLVFQDTIKGLVAGIRLTSNDMLHKGDWITVPKAGANGIVEDMTLTTVKIRNFDNTIVTVTPQTLVDDSFQNWVGMQKSQGRRANRRVYYDFRGIQIIDDAIRQRLIDKHYFKPEELKDTDVNMTLFRRYAERYLSEHPQVNAKMTLMVRQLEATQCGLPVEFYFFIRQKEWVKYEHLLAEIMDYFYAITPDFGLKVYEQYPEQ